MPKYEQRYKAEMAHLDTTPLGRRCADCSRILSESSFPRQGSKHIPSLTCQDCIDKVPLIAAVARQEKEVQERITELQKAMIHASGHTSRLEQIADTMISKMGGVEKLCGQWKDQIDEAAERKPGGKTVLDQYYAIFKMSALANKDRREEDDLTRKTMSELNEAILEYVGRVITANEAQTSAIVDAKHIATTE